MPADCPLQEAEPIGAEWQASDDADMGSDGGEEVDGSEGAVGDQRDGAIGRPFDAFRV